MKFGSDKTKYPGRIFAAILLLLAILSLLFYASIQRSAPKRAKLLMAVGDYPRAAEIYLEQGDMDMYRQCYELYIEQSYMDAQQKLQRGEYEAALSVFVNLGDYKDSRNLTDACCYLWAQELVQEGDFDQAMELAYALEDYPGKEQLIETCAQHMIYRAKELMLSGSAPEAAELLFSLGTLGGADKLAAQARRMEDWLSSSQSRIMDESRKFLNSYYEEVYVSELAYVIVPENCSVDCRFLLYFPGGKDDEINIDFLYYYLMNPAPDTIAVFLRTNGIYDIPSKCRAAIELMERTAAECGVFIDEIVSCGSSLGAYPAMQSAVYIPQLYSIRVPCVLSLDAGDDWNSPYCLSRSQCLGTAAMGTEFYLFESPWVGTDRAAIRRMVETGNYVILVGCSYDEHVRITLDAMGMGVLHWALGDRTKPCELDIYTFTRLTE